MEFVGFFLASAFGSVVGVWVGLALGGSRAAKALRDHLREKKWLREASLTDRIITRSGADNPGRTRVKSTPISRSRMQ